VYDFNLLISYLRGTYSRARGEIRDILKRLGDEEPLIKRTFAEGIIGLKTQLDPRKIIEEVRRLFERDPFLFQYTLKWVPVDLWTYSDMDSMKEGIVKLEKGIRVDEKWRMTIEKRRYTQFHKDEIIRELAELVDKKVDLENPDKILRIDIIGKYAGMSLLKPRDIFSVAKPLIETQVKEDA